MFNWLKEEKECINIPIETLDSLIEHLEVRFSGTLPHDKTISIEELRVLQGNREVIEYITDLVASDRLG